ncbi:hypothetical protein ACU5DF_01015 [Aliivibrio wodanis]|uniref:hypothetical protein n=1 Tax=Aliivibrio wodanis TaxID=80852 RepID=UPI00406CD9DA
MYNALKHSIFIILIMALVNYLNKEPVEGRTEVESNKIQLFGIEKSAKSLSVLEGNKIVNQLMLEQSFYDAILFIDHMKENDEKTYLMRGLIEYIELNNHKKALLSFYKIPANPIARYFISEIYNQYGDTEKSMYWMKLAAGKGLLEGQYKAAQLYRKAGKYNEAYIWARCATLNGYLKAESLAQSLSTQIFLKEKQAMDKYYTRGVCPKNKSYSTLLDKLGYRIN